MPTSPDILLSLVKKSNPTPVPIPPPQVIGVDEWASGNPILGATECEIEKIDGFEALQLDYKKVPVFTSCDWGGKKMNQKGLGLDPQNGLTEQVLEELVGRIAQTNK
jgi:hypothetical protein